MNITDTLQNQFELKELELNSLLEVTQAINNNLPETSLYKIYNFTLRANLSINKLALYVLQEHKGQSEQWGCKTNFGTETDFNNILLPQHFLPIQEISYVHDLNEPSLFDEFDILIPVLHKERVLALVFVSGLKKDTDASSTQTGTTFIQALSNIIIVAIENKKLARRQLAQEAIRKEMEIAQQVQQFLFPKNLPRKPGLSVEASYVPHYSVGGDYYDFIQLTANYFLVCIADVSGKGIPAALLMSNFQAALRTIARQTMNLKEIVNELNYQVMQSANGENFITFFAAIFDKESRKLLYINAGHIPPLLIHQNQVTQLDQGTVILGSFQPLPFLNQGVIYDLDDFLLFAYTDGLTETFNANEEEFGIERLEELLTQQASSKLPSLHQEIFDTLTEFNGGKEYDDDITFLSVRVNTSQLMQG